MPSMISRLKFAREYSVLWLRKPQNRILLIAMAAMLVIIGFVKLHSSTEPTVVSPSSADTYIPEGFVLVPIEIQNSESFSSLIGDFAVVDLFRGPHSQPVGRRLKMLRAPLNPQQFAVLVPEAEVSSLLQNAGAFWVAIQNPNMTKDSEIAKHSKKSRIEYFEEK